MKATLRALLRGEHGQDMLEWALLGALLSIVSIIALQGLGGIIHSQFTMFILQFRHSGV